MDLYKIVLFIFFFQLKPRKLPCYLLGAQATRSALDILHARMLDASILVVIVTLAQQMLTVLFSRMIFIARVQMVLLETHKPLASSVSWHFGVLYFIATA